MTQINNPNMARILIRPEESATRNDVMKAAKEYGQVLSAKPQAVSVNQAATDANAKKDVGFWGEDGFTFGDLLDLINPLQHIPIVSTIYRSITGDEIGAGPRMIGGAALGGIVGFATAAVNAAIESETGKDISENMLAAVTGFGEDDASAELAGLSNTELANKAKLSALSIDSDAAFEELTAEAEAIAPTPEQLQWAPYGEEMKATKSTNAAMEALELGPQDYHPGFGSLDKAQNVYRSAQMQDKIYAATMDLKI